MTPHPWTLLITNIQRFCQAMRGEVGMRECGPFMQCPASALERRLCQQPPWVLGWHPHCRRSPFASEVWGCPHLTPLSSHPGSQEKRWVRSQPGARCHPRSKGKVQRQPSTRWPGQPCERYWSHLLWTDSAREPRAPVSWGPCAPSAGSPTPLGRGRRGERATHCT